MSSAPEIHGSLPIHQYVDQNGSWCLDVSIQLPPSRLSPDLSLSYHSASHDTDAVGPGWVLKGLTTIERTPAILATDGFRGMLQPPKNRLFTNVPSIPGSVNYDSNDRFSLNGSRLAKIGDNEYRYEVEHWSKFITYGSDPANPDYWIEYLPDGHERVFGNTTVTISYLILAQYSDHTIIPGLQYQGTGTGYFDSGMGRFRTV